MNKTLIVLALALTTNLAAAASKPSRPPVKGCQWEKISDPKLGLEAWVQKCDFGFRKINFLTNERSLLIRYSDGGEPDPLIDVLPLLQNEKAESGLRRIFDSGTEKSIARRCVLAPFRGTPARAGVKRYTFVPDAAYARELKAKEDPNEIPDPPCGELGDPPDGIQYFEVQPSSKARRLMFVRIGQDEPLFDENSLQLLSTDHK